MYVYTEDAELYFARKYLQYMVHECTDASKFILHMMEYIAR